MPFNPTTVTNGAKVVHSSELSANLAAWEAAPHRYVVGASKAALDVITSLDVAEAESGRLTWAHRGHIIFTNREKVSVAHIGEGLPHTEKAQAQAQAVEVMKGMIQGTATGNQLLKNQAFEGYCKMFLSSGKGHYVREPLSRMGTAQRGGVESEANIEHGARARAALQPRTHAGSPSAHSSTPDLPGVSLGSAQCNRRLYALVGVRYSCNSIGLRPAPSSVERIPTDRRRVIVCGGCAPMQLANSSSARSWSSPCKSSTAPCTWSVPTTPGSSSLAQMT